MLARWGALARGEDPAYDESGALIITSGAALRQWLVAEGGFAMDEVA